ncbi:MAG: shikimate dehydrogenase [Bacteroidetes bacterium]|nr:shikimate dehydrogenase [Bacteroidota bacterium]
MRSSYPLRDFLSSDLINKPFALVIGHPIKHSLSPLIHNYVLKEIKSDVTYYPVDVSLKDFDRLENLFKNPHFRGANVTIPHKRSIIPFLDSISETVRHTGSCNTIVPVNGYLQGENTDVEGFMRPLHEYNTLLEGKNAIIFGSGGASDAIAYGLKKTGIKQIYIVSRKAVSKVGDLSKDYVKYLGYDQWTDVINSVGLLINTTPLGMYPDTESSVVNPTQEEFLHKKICYDIVYRPQQTMFLRQAARQHAICIDGTEMFLGQAAFAFELFFNQKFPLDRVRPVLLKALGQ